MLAASAACRSCFAVAAPCNAACRRVSPPRPSRPRLVLMATSSVSGQLPVPGLVDSAWHQKDIVQRYPRLREDIAVDVCVVGAGIAGLSTALALAGEGVSVAVVESRVRGGGQTGRTTAHIMRWFDDYYYYLIDMHGEEKARLVAEAMGTAASWIEDVVQTEGIECHFRRLDGFLYANEPSDVEDLTKELVAAHKAGLLDTQLVDLGGGGEVGGIKDALLFPNNADFHPLMYLDGLAAALERRGGRIFEGTKACATDNGEVVTEGGARVRCDHVVLATNSPINLNLAVHSRQGAYRTYVVGLVIHRDAYRLAEYWSTEEPYHYIRAEDYDDQNYLLIVGGEDHLTGVQPSENPYLKLEKYARARWPACREVALRWSGQVMEPPDLLHLIGPDPLKPAASTMIITGDSGQGMTGGTIGALLVTDLILGRPNPWADVFSPSRLPPAKAALESAVVEGGAVAASYAERILPRVTLSYELAPGTGKVVQTATENKVALYCDEKGVKHAYSAVCTHLGCIVHWNDLNKSWDCPCHGSNFSPYGEVINGPARSALEKLEW